MTTQQDKTLAIAKAMNPDKKVVVFGIGIKQIMTVHIYTGSVRTPFNPFTNAEDAMSVLEWIKDNYHVDIKAMSKANWVVTVFSVDNVCNETFKVNKDLKTAIAECAYQIVMSEVE